MLKHLNATMWVIDGIFRIGRSVEHMQGLTDEQYAKLLWFLGYEWDKN